MLDVRFVTCCLVAAFLTIASAMPEKQIKLEDIEKDTLKAAQQAKAEKQLQEQSQYQQQAPQYRPQQQFQQYGTQQSLAYQNPTAFFQYVVPQQYVPLTDYSALASNGLGVGYASPTTHAYQAYLNPLLTSIPTASDFHASPAVDTVSQTQPLLFTFTSPLSAFQQQQYSSGFQYYPSQQPPQQQTTQYYYTPQVVNHGSSAQYSSAPAYPATQQQYVSSYQPATTAVAAAAAPGANKGAVSYTNYVSTGPQSFSTQTYTSHQRYNQPYNSPTYSSNTELSNSASPATFTSVKAPQHLAASAGQKQQYAQALTTTLSPLQTKYLNSPQYLAQNYNTIQASQLSSTKGSFTSGAKPTAGPTLKTSTVVGSGSGSSSGSSSSGVGASGSYLPSSYLPAASFNSPVFQSYKNFALKNF